MNKSIPTRNLTSNLWVWYPNIDSRLKSFHHRKVVKTKKNIETNKNKKVNFKLTHKTKLDIVENKAKDTKIGQKEVWTGRKGLKNI